MNTCGICGAENVTVFRYFEKWACKRCLALGLVTPSELSKWTKTILLELPISEETEYVPCSEEVAVCRPMYDIDTFVALKVRHFYTKHVHRRSSGKTMYEGWREGYA